MNLSSIKESLPTVFSIVFVLSVYAGCTYLLSHKDEPSTKDRNECSIVSYYDPVEGRDRSNYFSSTVYGDDSLVNFTDQNGITWWRYDFFTDEDRSDTNNVDYNDITLKNGKRYKVTFVSDGKCKTEQIEDSLFNEVINTSNKDDSNDDNNN